MAAINKYYPKKHNHLGPNPAPKAAKTNPKPKPKAGVQPAQQKAVQQPKHPNPKSPAQHDAHASHGVAKHTVVGNLAYQIAWTGYEDMRGIDLDLKEGKPLLIRDKLAKNFDTGNSCLQLAMLALSNDPVTINWLGKLKAGPTEYSDGKKMLNQFCTKEGVELVMYEYHPGTESIKERHRFGKDQRCNGTRFMLSVPTNEVVDGAMMHLRHVLPVRRLNPDHQRLIGSIAACVKRHEAGLEEPQAKGLVAEGGKHLSELPNAELALSDQQSSPKGAKSDIAVSSGCVAPTPAGKLVTAPAKSGAPDNALKCALLLYAAEAAAKAAVTPPVAEPDIGDEELASRALSECEALVTSANACDRAERAIARVEGAGNVKAQRAQAKQGEPLDVDVGELFWAPEHSYVGPPPAPATQGCDAMSKGAKRWDGPAPVYEGSWEPHVACRWRGGWFSAKKPASPDRWAAFGRVPDIASATLAQASKWLHRCLYVPVTPEEHRLSETAAVTCGDETVFRFEEGWVVELHGRKYLARGHDIAFPLSVIERYGFSGSRQYLQKRVLSLELCDDDCMADCKVELQDILYKLPGMSLLAKEDPQAKVCEAGIQLAREVPEQTQLKAGYARLLDRVPEHNLPEAVIFRNDAAMRTWETGKGAVKPNVCERYIAAHTRETDRPWGFAGGTRYQWGYCYGCGKERPGQFKGRLCGTCVNSTPSARMLAYGYSAVKPGSIVYPGVVQVPTLFPPLKQYGSIATPKTLQGVPLDPELLRNMPYEQTMGARLGGIGFNNLVPFSYPRGPGVLGAALYLRAFRDVPINVEKEAFQKAAELAWIIAPDFCLPRQEWEQRTWLQSMPPNRRKPLLKAHERREERGQNHKDYEWFNPFVKDEHALYAGVLDGVIGTEFCQSVPRTIFAPHDETHLDAGRYLKPLVGALKQIWHARNWIFYASGKPESLDEWLNENCHATSWFWADYSAFERSHSDASWDFMEGMYRQIYPHADEKFWQALAVWRRPKGKKKFPKQDVRIEFHCQTMNASGRDDTSLSNAMLNGFGLSMAFAAALSGKTIYELQAEDLRDAESKVKIAVMGDDSLVACNFDIDAYKETVLRELKRFGFVVKACSSHQLVDVTFLGMMPYPVAGTYYWGPTIGRRLYKAFWQHVPKGNLPAWTHGTAKQLALNACVPIVSDAAQQVLKILEGKKATAIAATPEGYGAAWTMREAPTPPYDESTLRWLELRYPGVTVAQLKQDVSLLNGVTRLPAMVDIHSMSIIAAMDEM